MAQVMFRSVKRCVGRGGAGDCTCVYRYCNVQRGVGGEDYRRMGTWMVAKRADGGLSFKVEGIPEASTRPPPPPGCGTG